MVGRLGIGIRTNQLPVLRRTDQFAERFAESGVVFDQGDGVGVAVHGNHQFARRSRQFVQVMSDLVRISIKLVSNQRRVNVEHRHAPITFCPQFAYRSSVASSARSIRQKRRGSLIGQEPNSRHDPSPGSEVAGGSLKRSSVEVLRS